MVANIILLASFLSNRAIRGLSFDFDKALDLLRNYNDFTIEEASSPMRLLSAGNGFDDLVPNVPE